MGGRFRAGFRALCRQGLGTGVAALALGWASTAGAVQAAPEAAATDAAAHDFPTYERVRYVLACIERNGGAPALVYQCSCAIDQLAARFDLDTFVEMQTAVNGATIAGERGGELRDNSDLRAEARKYRDAEAAAYKSCGVRGSR